MINYTPHQARYFAEQIQLKRPQSSFESIASAMSGVKVDLNPHQVDAAMFAVKSPLNNGAILADEVGLGKTIEAGLVLSQYWAERKRKIILIVPASLRMQWRQELDDKFYIDSILMESKEFNQLRKNGSINPFEVSNKVVICSYDFASRKAAELKAVNWDLVIMDEAHRLRNVYKTSNVTGNRLKSALNGKKKLLLTATPLQNNLMELYGLVSIIDDHVFGDAKTFREMYVTVNNTEIRNRNLKKRLHPFCQRTLRSQVTEYVRYTNRIPILQEYTPSADEEKLYNFISDYLQTDKLYALPEGQRTLITMVLRKLLASSSFAISGTLNSLIERLNNLLLGVESELDIEDYDTIDELKDSFDDEENITAELIQDREGIIKELAQLEEYAKLAQSITENSKGENLLTALHKGFDETEKLGGQRKAVIFTESRRTQDYLYNLLSNNGYAGQIVFLNGSNSDADSKRILNEWKERHKNDGRVSGSRTADIKAAVVEEFKDRASILIGTEAAAEGINLQFCSLLVNYDLPWNPQRIEQRIGRCHRYGQKNDVVVINFLNRKNAADVRVYQLLDQKFRLFSGVFGSSDEVLGSIESGVDFEKRIAGIYQKCKTSDEITQKFDELQEEMAEAINEKMTQARQTILENFDEDVAAKLKDCQTSTVASMDKYTRWLYYFFLMHGAKRVEPLEQLRFRVDNDGKFKTYNLDWKSAEKSGDIFLRKDDKLYSDWLDEAKELELAPVTIEFDYSGNNNRHIAFFDSHIGLKGMLSIDKVSYEGIGEEEHLIFTIKCDDGTVLDEELINSMMELRGTVVGDCRTESDSFVRFRQELIAYQQQQVEENNKKYYLEECDKLDAYSEDLKEGLKRELKDLKKAITEKNKEFRASTNLPLSEMLEIKDDLEKMKKKRRAMERDINKREDEIDEMNERLQDEIREKLKGNSKITHIMTIGFKIK